MKKQIVSVNFDFDQFANFLISNRKVEVKRNKFLKMTVQLCENSQNHQGVQKVEA
jgi:hypothetical protein